MQGAQAVSLAVATRDVTTALDGMSQADKVAVLLGVLGDIGRGSGQPDVFMALVQQAVQDRVGSGAFL